MVKSPEERENSLRRSLSQSDGDTPRGLDANAEVQQRAMQRYHRLLKTDPQLQANAFDQEKVDWLIENCPTCIEIFQGLCKVYAERPMYGFCMPGSDEWQTISYKQVHERVVHFAAGLQALKAYKREDFVGICGFASVDWVTADFADTYSGVTTVPLPTNIQAEDIVKIINEAELTCLICSLGELAGLASLVGGCETVKAFVVMDLPSTVDPDTHALIKKAEENLPSGCKMYTMPDVISLGQKSPVPGPVIPGQDGHDDNPIFSLFYTSGSTGLPKGAIYREQMWHRYWTNAMLSRINTASINLGFLPLNHIMGRLSMNSCLMAGGSTWFVRKSDMSTFFEDIKVARPTSMMIIPRIANMLFDQAQEQLRKAKDENKQAVIEDFREKELGGRVLTCMTGSAPTAPEVVEFLRDALVVPIYEGYGSTECGMITRDWEFGQNVTEWKLVDVPDLGYYTTDKPFPRGELLIKTKTMIDGYYKHQDKWQEDLREGFMATGDVMEQRGPKTVVWIDRKKNIMKLSQGEFVSTSRLEATYAGNSDLIHQMYIYGSSLRSYLLAAVVPSKIATQKYNGPELKKALRRDIDNLARTKALQGYEIPRDFIVEMDPFSKSNHLLTDSGKPARGKLKGKYGPVFEEMYQQMEARQRERQNQLRDQAAQDGSVLDKVKQAAALTLGIDTNELGDGNSSFNQLGGDSLAAIQFAREVDNLCGTTLPVSFVLDHSHSMKDIVEKVESLLKGDAPDAITFERIHGRDSKMIKAKDLDLHRFAPRGLPLEVTNAVSAEELPAEPEKVLLTGANGFLGRFLLLDFLKRVSSKKDGLVVAIVRANGDDAAYSRLRAGYDSGDEELIKLFDSLASKHLRVYAGDLSKPNLGLKPDVYRELAQSLDTVIHNGALVNHAFTYEQLFEPNVLGSLEVMKLAVRYKRKAMTFISSVGVAGPLGITEDVKETTLGTNIAEEFPGSGGYAFGYGCSKWATEVQLQQLNKEFGVPVSVFRCGMILAHSRYLGQQNPTDMFTRLLASLVYTGVAPESFYKDPTGPDRHYDGMPVDFVAEGIAGVASAQRRGCGLYHVVNPHWEDNVSLDSFLDWIPNAGYPLKRISDYTQWYQQFKGALEKLDSKLAGNSSLPIVYQWEHQMTGPVLKFDATQMRKKAAETTRWKDVPHLDEPFIHQNLKHMVALQIIGPPGHSLPGTKALEKQ